MVHPLPIDGRERSLRLPVDDDQGKPRDDPHGFVSHTPPGGDADSVKGCSAKSRSVHLWHSRYSLFRVLTRDGWLLFLTRCARLFAYGALSVVLVFYLTSLGLSTSQTGVLLTLTLVGDTVVSLYLTTHADRIGRRRMLIVGAILMAAARLAVGSPPPIAFLVVAGAIRGLSSSGNE